MLQSIWELQWGKRMDPSKHSNDPPSSCVALWAESELEGAWCVFLATGVHHSDTPAVPICSPSVCGKTLLFIQTSFVF